jgi:hypothetical protein
MTFPLLPKATAVWLVDNTTLTFGQIAEFCGMHPLEVQGIADGEVANGIIGKDPIVSNQLTRKEIERCEKDPQAKITLQLETEKYIKSEKNKKKKSRYTPVARRQDKPDAIAWIIKHCPDATDMQITKLIGTTKKTIEAIRLKSHWNYANLTPRDPVLLGLCSQRDLNFLISIANEAKDKKASASA